MTKAIKHRNRQSRRWPTELPDELKSRPPIPAPAEPRQTELIGLTEDGRMVLWSTGMVKPVSAFESRDNGRRIENAHYVLDWHGHAITAHCSSEADGFITVQIMCSRIGSTVRMSRSKVESLLLGKVIPDPVEQEKISRLLREMGDDLVASVDTPHRQRGRI